MLASPFLRKSIAGLGIDTIVYTAPLLARAAPLRHAALWTGEQYIRFSQDGANRTLPLPLGEKEDFAQFGQAIWNTADHILDHHLSQSVLRSIARNLVSGIMVEGGQRTAISQFHERFGNYPPGFLTISPGKTCNLHCAGCYANAGPTSEKLDWATFDRIITEAKALWGVRFIVISGGEPLAYHSEGRGILDAAEKHPDVFFLMYTNGTLITEAVAERLAILGNVTPAISVEGWRERTDERRGAGVFNKAVAAMRRLCRSGVPFGVSLTATRHNVEEIFSDEFIDFFFQEQGALYGWIFHYMPIGRSFTLDLMPTPEQRVRMWERVWDIIRKRHIFLVDFWNHGTLSYGCISAGRTRGGGYLYIDWNGAVSPCVFVPYSPMNIREVYANGGTLNDVWAHPFFADIRNWQEDYWQDGGNWLAPCIIRDHHRDLRRLVARHEPEPTDDNARKALLDPDYAHGMDDYGAAYQTLSNPLWQENYLRLGGRGNYRKRP
jgi:MoaA/NifB/PqqE/SkfB family radical SAM enzyme